MAKPTIEDAQEKWELATTFDEMCELTAQFVEGTLPYFPGYGSSSVDQETADIQKFLARLNRQGL